MVNFKLLATAAAAFFGTAAAAPVQQSQSGKIIENSYIITLKSGTASADLESHISWVNGVHSRSLGKRQNLSGVQRTYDGGYDFHGYSGEFDAATIEEIRNDPNVAIVEEDKVWEIDFIQASEGASLGKRELTTQSPATWGLGTVSHRDSGSEEYIYDTVAGTDTFAYIVDTGINDAHSDFGGRASKAYTAFPGDEEDSVGHGTHVAGTIGSATYGVAKQATLFGVKVFQGSSSSTSIILEGFNWAVEDITSNGRQDKSVVNLSLGGAFSESFNAAIDAASEAGVISAIAAGNSAQDASGFSPASAPSAITVGALDSDWSIASYSNYGEVLDIFAPGTDIESTWIGGNDATNVISGTSMATPHVAGLVLYALSVDGVTGVAGVTEFLKSSATPDKIGGSLNGSPNVIGNNNNSQQ